MNYSQVKRNTEDLKMYEDAFFNDDTLTMHSIELRHGCYGLAPERALIKLTDDKNESISRYRAYLGAHK